MSASTSTKALPLPPVAVLQEQPQAASHSLTQASGRPRHTLLIDRQDAEYWLAADDLLAQNQSPPIETVQQFPRTQTERPKYAQAPSLPLASTSRNAARPAYARRRAGPSKIGLGLDMSSSSSSSPGAASQAMMTPSHSSSSSSYFSSPSRLTARKKRNSGYNEFEAHTAALRKLYPASPVHVSPRGRRPSHAPPLTPTVSRNSATVTDSVRSQSGQSARQLSKRKMATSTSDSPSTRSASMSSALAAPTSPTTSPRSTSAHGEDVFESPRPAPPAPRENLVRPMAEHRRAVYDSPSQSLVSMSQGEQTPSSSPSSVIVQKWKATPRSKRPLQPALAAAAALSAAAGPSTLSLPSPSSHMQVDGLGASPNLSIHPGSSLLHATPRFDVGHAAFDASLLHKHSSPTASPSVYTQESPAIQETMMSSFPDPPQRCQQNALQGAAQPRSSLNLATAAREGRAPRGKKPLPPPPPPTDPLPRAPKSAMEPVPKAILPKIRPFRSREELRAWSLGIGEAATLPDTPDLAGDGHSPRSQVERSPDSSAPATSAALVGFIYASNSQDFTSSEPDLLSRLTREVQSVAECKSRSRFVERLSQDGKYASMIRFDDAFDSPMLTSESGRSSEPATSGESALSKVLETASTDDTETALGSLRINLGGSLSPGSNESHKTGILLSPVKAKSALDEVNMASLQKDFIFPGTNRVTFASLPKPEHAPTAPVEEPTSVFSGPLRWLPNVRSNSRSSAAKYSARQPLSPRDDTAHATPTSSSVEMAADGPTTPTTKKISQHNRNASSKSSTASSAVSCTFTHKSNLSTSTAASSHEGAPIESASMYTVMLDGTSPTRRTAELMSTDGPRKIFAKVGPTMNAIPEASPNGSFISRMDQQTPVVFEVMPSSPNFSKRDCASAHAAPPPPPRRSSVFASLDAAKIHERAARRMQAVIKQERNSANDIRMAEEDGIETLADDFARQDLDGTQTGDYERSPNLESSETHQGMSSLPSCGTLDIAARDRWSSLISNGDDYSSMHNHGAFGNGFVSAHVGSITSEDMQFVKPRNGEQALQREHYGIAL